MNNLEFELESLKLLRQHAQGKYKHLSKDILLSNGQTLKEYLDALDVTIADYEARITALEEGGGGGGGVESTGDVFFREEVRGKFFDCEDYLMFNSDGTITADLRPSFDTTNNNYLYNLYGDSFIYNSPQDTFNETFSANGTLYSKLSTTSLGGNNIVSQLYGDSFIYNSPQDTFNETFSANGTLYSKLIN